MLFRRRVGARPAAASFEPAARSAFRTLGLAATAAQGEVFDAASSVRLALRLGVEKSFEGDLPWLGAVARTESDVRDALGRLSEPAQRARERLFWFHGRVGGARVSNVKELWRVADSLLHADSRPSAAPGRATRPDGPDDSGGARSADEVAPDEDAAASDEDAAALHDAALVALAGLVRLDPSLRERESWGRAFGLWRRLFAREEFWSLLVAADLKGDFEQSVTFGEVDELRLQAPRVVSAHVAARARDAALAGDFRAAARAFGLLRGADLPAPLLREYEEETVGPAEDALVIELNKAFMWVESLGFNARTPAARRNYCNDAWRKFDRLRARLNDFADLAGADSYAARRVFEHASSKLLRLSEGFEAAGRREECVFICRRARALAPPGSEELRAAEERLRALGAGEGTEGRTPEGYAGELARELSDVDVPPRLFRDDPKGDRTLDSHAAGGDRFGWLTVGAFWLLMVASCFGLQRCGAINMRPTRTPIHSLPSVNIRPNLNFNLNLNYNIPPPLNLRPYGGPPPRGARTPGGKRRRQPRDRPPAPAPPPPRIERAPAGNAPPRR